MKIRLSKLRPELLVGGAILVASALARSSPRSSWSSFAGPVLLALALVAADLVDRRERRLSGPRFLPSASALFLAAAIMVASAILVTSDPARLAAMIPILGSCAAIPLLQRREPTRSRCRPA